MSGPTIETDLGKILDQINQNLKETNQKLDALQKDVTEIRIVQVRFEAEVKGDLKALQGEFNTLQGDLKEIKGSQKATGIDVGLKFFLVDSEGHQIHCPNYYRKATALRNFEMDGIIGKIFTTATACATSLIGMFIEASLVAGYGIYSIVHKKILKQSDDALHKLFRLKIGKNLGGSLIYHSSKE